MDDVKRIPLLGESFPQLTVQTTHGLLKLPEHYQGKWWVLFSHPADFTPVCTTEFIAFQKRKDAFDALQAELIGLSVDQVFSHLKWIEWIREKTGVEITFPIIADTGSVAQTLGLIHPGKGTNTVRAVFIIDPQGKIRLIIYYPPEIGRNIDEILRALRALQTSDAERVALPAGWPENELIGESKIIPPPTSLKEKQERLTRVEKEGLDCYDWWFCYTKA